MNKSVKKRTFEKLCLKRHFQLKYFIFQKLVVSVYKMYMMNVSDKL